VRGPPSSPSKRPSGDLPQSTGEGQSSDAGEVRGNDNSESTEESGEIRQELNEELEDIRSQQATLDSLVTNGEFSEAKEMLADIEHRLDSLNRRGSRQGLDEFESEIKRLQRRYSNYLSKSRVISLLREMDYYEFEQLVAKIWSARGWKTKVTRGSADRGVDVIATKQDAFERRRHLIQAKCHGENSKVGSEDIQRYAGLYARDEDVDAVFVVTTNGFTSEAKKVAGNRDVTLVNADELYEMLRETSP
jgi:restriction endonuclease Mrr